MKRYVLSLIAVLFLALQVQHIEATQSMWVSSRGATLKAQNQSSSETIADLQPGMKLNVIEYENRWYKVSTPDGKTGWVYRGRLSQEQPEFIDEQDSEEDSLSSLLGDSSESSIQADSADSSRSIRGLSPEAEEYAKQSGSPKKIKKALDSVLAMKTKDRDIENFLKKGKIGEYAE